MISLHRIALLSLALLATLAPARGLQDPDAIEISINEITSIDWRPGQELPDGITSLNGKTVSIEGYMALGTLEGVTRFELVPEPCECGRSKVQHFIDVSVEEGLVSYKPGRITLTGTFEASEIEEDGYVISLFRMRIRSLD